MIILAIFFAPNHSISQFKTRFVNVHIDGLSSPKIQSTSNNYNTKHIGLGGSIAVGGKIFNTVLEYDYNQIDITNSITNTKTNIKFSEFFLGVRYYTIRPTFIIGKTAVRLNAAYLYGFDMEPNYKSLVVGGLSFSSVTNASGISVNFVYRPDKVPIKGYTFQPSYALRFAIVFGPKG